MIQNFNSQLTEDTTVLHFKDQNVSIVLENCRYVIKRII